MSLFLEKCAAIAADEASHVIRISHVAAGGEIETAEIRPGSRCQNVYSVAKTFTMTAVGLLWDRGLIRMEERIIDILEEEATDYGMDGRWRESTVEMALTHRLGFTRGFLDIDTTPASVFGRDYLRYALTHPLACAPGGEARYSDGAFYLLSRVVEKRAEEALDNFLWRELCYPLGFQEMAFSRCPLGHPMGATGLYIGSEDMAKLGLVYLEEGEYKGRRLLSRDWVKLALEKAFGFDVAGDSPLAVKGGMYGQKLYIDRGARRVVAVQAHGADNPALGKWIAGHGGTKA